MTEYTAATTNNSNAVTATPADTNATVTLKLGGTKTARPVTWADGENALTVEVSNGDAAKTYKVTVTKTTT